jgi:hypothetical protein
MAPAFPSQSSDETNISTLIAAAEAFARSVMETEAHDASHDYSHVERVRRCALQLAEEEGLPATSQEIVSFPLSGQLDAALPYSVNPSAAGTLLNDFSAFWCECSNVSPLAY